MFSLHLPPQRAFSQFKALYFHFNERKKRERYQEAFVCAEEEFCLFCSLTRTVPAHSRHSLSISIYLQSVDDKVRGIPHPSLRVIFFFWWNCTLSFLNLFSIGGQLLYSIVLVSAIHQHKSAIGIHMSPPSWTFLRPPTPSRPSRLSQSTMLELPTSHSKF